MRAVGGLVFRHVSQVPGDDNRVEGILVCAGLPGKTTQNKTS